MIECLASFFAVSPDGLTVVDVMARLDVSKTQARKALQALFEDGQITGQAADGRHFATSKLR